MKRQNILIIIGVILFIIMTSLDRFVVSIPNYIFIPLAIMGIVLILVGCFIDKKKL